MVIADKAAAAELALVKLKNKAGCVNYAPACSHHIITMKNRPTVSACRSGDSGRETLTITTLLQAFS